MITLPLIDPSTHQRLMEMSVDLAAELAPHICIAALVPLIARDGAFAVAEMLREWAAEIERRYG